MIINWVEVRRLDGDKEDSGIEYIVGATTEERVLHTGFLDVNESNPASVTLKTFPGTNHADTLDGHIHYSDSAHPEHSCGVAALKDLVACVLEIKGMTAEEAHEKLYGRTIQPVVVGVLGLPCSPLRRS